MLTAFLALMRKDLKLFLLDRRAVLMSVVAPIAIASFFGYIFGGGAGNTDSRIPVVVADLDGSDYSRDVVEQLQSDRTLAVKVTTPEAARDAVHKGKAAAAIIIPKNFSDDTINAALSRGSKPHLEMPYDPSRAIEMRMIQGVTAGIAARSIGKRIIPGWEMKMPFEIDSQEARAKYDGQGAPYNGYAHAFGGMGIQFLLMVGAEIGIVLLTKRRQGAWKRLRAAPLSRGVLLGSVAASSALESMATFVVLFTFARLVFGVKIQGSFLGFLLICVGFSLMTATLGLLIATIGNTPESTRAVAILVILFLVMLGGAWVPAFLFPAWLQKLTMGLPTRWAMDGFDGVLWRGLGFDAVQWNIALLFGCALVFGTIAVMRFRWEE
jgi:ABC-2 type transport system permease protein